jgi:N-hydroxyarylamine O-acetyltransferase
VGDAVLSGAVPTFDTDAYLARLRLPNPEPPSAGALRALHAAQVERIPYEALEIQLGRPTTIDPYDSADRILRQHRGGYCYHLNGALSLLLGALGYDVRMHRAGVQPRSAPRPPGTAWANHLALTVHGLVTDDCPSGEWLVDAGLGDALHEPLPLHEGTYTQGPFTYRLGPSDTEPGCWRFDHDPRGSFRSMEFGPAEAAFADFTERHVHLSTAPESGFVRTCAVQRRDATGADTLTGLVLRRVPGGSQTLEKKSEWFDALADVFDLPLADEDEATRDRLWKRVLSAHEAWA